MNETMTKLYLAPMEGVTDYVMRDILSSISISHSTPALDQCTTEFLRVTNSLYPKSVFLRNCPELAHHRKSHTQSGVPVFVQLLGSDPDWMAENAVRAAEFGAVGIDLNFGCPAPTVNRHEGGASLLQYPERIFSIVSKVRQSLPQNIPLTAKMRLGFHDTSLVTANAQAIENGGAQSMTVHCRTKEQGYRPPAYWEWIPRIQEVVSIPITANGDIWTLNDYVTCKKVTAAQGFMIGRGILRNPFLFQQIKAHESGQHTQAAKQVAAYAILALVLRNFDQSREIYGDAYAVAKTKQWMKQIALVDSNLSLIFETIKILRNAHELRDTIAHCLSNDFSGQSQLETFC